MPRTPVTVIAGLEQTLRDTAVGVLLCDLPGATAVGLDLLDDGARLRTTLHRRSGVLQVTDRLLEGDCIGCAAVEQVLGALAELGPHRVTHVVVALPPTLEPRHPAAALAARLGAAPAVGVVVDPQSLVDDLLGDDLLAERGLAFDEDDRRAVGEVLAHQLEHADAVLLAAPAAAAPGRLLRHLSPAGALVVGVFDDGTGPAVARLAAGPPDRRSRDGLSDVMPSGEADGDGVWTLLLSSRRPFHPGRLDAALPVLGGGPLRGRGRFWLPTRPDLRCAWDGAGGQLRIGPLDRRAGDQGTRLVVTGYGRPAEQVRAAFEATLLTAEEFADGPAGWRQVDDGLDLWLGPRRVVA